jgi:hypothetical protein
MSSDKTLVYEQNDIIQLGDFSWRVLDVQNNKALVLSEKIIERRRYNDLFMGVTWETCSLRRYLNGEFFERFTEEEKSKILDTGLSNINNPWFDIKGGNGTNDKVFLLSLSDIVKYFGDSGRLSTKPSGVRRIDDQYNANRKAVDTEGTASWWWLRSPGFYALNATYVNADGWIYIDGNNVNLYGGGVRPALWLSL